MNNHYIHIDNKNNEITIKIDKDALRDGEEIRNYNIIKEKFLFKTTPNTSTQINLSKRRKSITLDYDSFLKELYSPVEKLQIKKKHSNKYMKKVKKSLENKGIYKLK